MFVKYIYFHLLLILITRFHLPPTLFVIIWLHYFWHVRFIPSCVGLSRQVGGHCQNGDVSEMKVNVRQVEHGESDDLICLGVLVNCIVSKTQNYL